MDSSQKVMGISQSNKFPLTFYHVFARSKTGWVSGLGVAGVARRSGETGGGRVEVVGVGPAWITHTPHYALITTPLPPPPGPPPPAATTSIPPALPAAVLSPQAAFHPLYRFLPIPSAIFFSCSSCCPLVILSFMPFPLILPSASSLIPTAFLPSFPSTAVDLCFLHFLSCYRHLLLLYFIPSYSFSLYSLVAHISLSSLRWSSISLFLVLLFSSCSVLS